jgi:hypothetical protein
VTGYTLTPYINGTAGSPINYGPGSTTVVISGLTNGSSYSFTVTATNGAGSSPPSGMSNAVTPSSNYPYVASGRGQYRLANSNGSTWIDVDSTNLSLTITPSTTSEAVISANADLWTATAGYNQDLGLTVNGTVVAWKESGGFAGTFSPNAAYVQTVYHMTAGTTYTVKLQWKTNRPAAGVSIFAGAGSRMPYSPTMLTAQLVPSSAGGLVSVVANQQYSLADSSGSAWSDLDPSNLALNYTPASSGTALLTANADLWTTSAGFNQDIGINVNGSIAGWKESGGFAGTFSPNAAFVQAAIPMTAGVPYQIKLQWKTNKPAQGATIMAGAGNGPYSPTRLTLRFFPAGSGVMDKASGRQYSLSGSDGVSWATLDPAGLSVTLTPATNCLAILSANADLFTSAAGFNQDLGIAVNGSLVSWKESGGFAGTYSPNAAYVQALMPVTAGHSSCSSSAGKPTGRRPPEPSTPAPVRWAATTPPPA